MTPHRVSEGFSSGLRFRQTMHRLQRLILSLAAIASIAALSSLAAASSPTDGTVSAASPSVTWKGTVTNGGVQNEAWGQDPTTPCQSPLCDTFTLNVATGAGVLTIKENITNTPTAGGEGNGSFRVTMPDGSQKVANGASSPKTALKLVIKNAPAGKYVVDMADGFDCCGPDDYNAEADLTIAGATPAPGATPVAGSTPGASSTPAAAPITLAIISPKSASAKKLAKAKKLAVSLKSSGALNGVNVLLIKGKKTIDKASLATLNGAGKVTLKVKKKLKAGSYALAAGGKDSAGNNVVASIKLKVSK